MRRQTISIALLAVLSTIAVSCQKENETNLAPETVVLEASATNTIQYTIDGVLHTTTIDNDSEWDALMQTIFALSREGYDIRIMSESRSENAFSSKETLVFTTTSETRASAWTKEKVKESYSVTVSFNKDTGEYICTAVR